MRQSSTVLTVLFSSLHCCVFGFSCHFVFMVFCTSIRAFVVMYFTHNKCNKMKFGVLQGSVCSMLLNLAKSSLVTV